MCALTPMFLSKQQQQECYSASTMEYPWLSRVEFFSPSLHLPSYLYPNPLAQSDGFKNFNINMNLSHCNGTNSNSNNGQEEDKLTVLEKKLNHNASERDRRRKLNALYSSLRDLLPDSDQKRKLSIPMTVARVVKYIPEQKQELQRLSRRKEQLLRKTHKEKRRSKPMDSIDFSSQKIAANWLTDTEIVVQIATSKWTSLSDMLLKLEANRLIVISVSSSVSSTGRIFYTQHLQMSGDCRVRLEELNDMLFGLNQSQ